MAHFWKWISLCSFQQHPVGLQQRSDIIIDPLPQEEKLFLLTTNAAPFCSECRGPVSYVPLVLECPKFSQPIVLIEFCSSYPAYILQLITYCWSCRCGHCLRALKFRWPSVIKDILTQRRPSNCECLPACSCLCDCGCAHAAEGSLLKQHICVAGTQRTPCTSRWWPTQFRSARSIPSTWRTQEPGTKRMRFTSCPSASQSCCLLGMTLTQRRFRVVTEEQISKTHSFHRIHFWEYFCELIEFW